MDSFLKSFQRLGQEFGITGKDLVTFMGNSATDRLNDDSFFKSLQRLTQVFGITGTNLAPSIGDSVADGSVDTWNETCVQPSSFPEHIGQVPVQ